MAEIRGGGGIPHGEDFDQIPRHVFPQMYNEGGVFVSFVQFIIGDYEAGGEVSDIGCDGAPEVDVGPG